jgi:hypothetical protein
MHDALVVSIGHLNAYVAVVREGVLCAAAPVEAAGALVTSVCQEGHGGGVDHIYPGQPWLPMDSFPFIRWHCEKVTRCYVSPSAQAAQADGSPNTLAAEALFHPSIAMRMSPGVVEVVLQVLKQEAMAGRSVSSLLANVLLTGGSVHMRGFVNRFRADLVAGLDDVVGRGAREQVEVRLVGDERMRALPHLLRRVRLTGSGMEQGERAQLTSTEAWCANNKVNGKALNMFVL